MTAHNSSSHDDPSSQGKKRILPKLILTFFILLAGATLFLGPIWKEKKDAADQQDEGIRHTTQPVSPQDTAQPESSSTGQNLLADNKEHADKAGTDHVDSNLLEEIAEPLETPSSGQIFAPEHSTGNFQSPPTCNGLANDLHAFFLDLDSKPYIQSYGLKTSTQEHFIMLLKKLLETPPVVTRETDDLYTILTNMAHFFRIMGKDNISLSKAVLGHEREKIEDVFKNLYTWAIYGNCSQKTFELTAPLEELYEYAGFFLNTMGGRSYLFRRDSRSRILINYYAVLITDQMQKRGRNRHGINIAQSIPLLINEIESSNQLIYKEQYLDTLYELLETSQQE
ncbi:hypothetical protein [Desulfogranum japonicum]|uniref:hypothetical protein n=1 Tax=Desulfogranum japonicum TaxID=231447 RepID=UPI0004213347|nr:hypothetical protein [Desulfogranum japonicum]